MREFARDKLLYTPLLPLSWVYAGFMMMRNRLFDMGIIPVHRVDVPVISVGNVTAGGTGKTPLVEYLVAECLKQGRRVGVISRGYGRRSRGTVLVSDGHTLRVDARDGGDEPAQIARKFPNAIVVVGERRVKAAETALQSGADVLLMDDGFQHRYLHRDLDIVVVDAGSDPYEHATLPAGRLREPWQGVRRADIIAFSRYDDHKTIGKWSEVRREMRDLPVVTFRYKQLSPQSVEGAETSIQLAPNEPVVIFSGIGNHSDFLRQMKDTGVRVANDIGFPDHHIYTDKDMRSIVNAAHTTGTRTCVTTEKDALRLRLMDLQPFKGLSLVFVPIELEFASGKTTLDDSLTRCLEHRRGYVKSPSLNYEGKLQ